jgi:hypothetical protein
MQITYRFRYDAEYIKTVVDRQYLQGSILLRLPVQFGTLGVLCAGAVVWSLRPSVGNGVALFAGTVLVAMVVGVLGTKLGLLLRFKGRPDFGSEVTVALSEEGVLARARNSEAKLTWATYPRSVRFRDGILLQKPGAIRWLPDSAIESGTADEATTLVGSKTVLRRVA